MWRNWLALALTLAGLVVVFSAHSYHLAKVPELTQSQFWLAYWWWYLAGAGLAISGVACIRPSNPEED